MSLLLLLNPGIFEKRARNHMKVRARVRKSLLSLISQSTRRLQLQVIPLSIPVCGVCPLSFASRKLLNALPHFSRTPTRQ